MKSVPILFLCLFLNLAQADLGQCSDEIRELMEPDQPRTNAYFFPKVPLSDLRFAYRFGLAFGIELDREMHATVPFLEESGLDVGWAHRECLTSSEEETLFGRIPQEKGQSYAIAVPELESVKLLSTTGIALMPYENWNFLLTLGERSRINAEDIADSIYPVGLAFPAEPEQSYTYKALGGEELSDAEVLSVEDILRSGLAQDFTIISCRRIYVDYPEKKGAAVLLRFQAAPSESKTLLFVVYERLQGLALARFEVRGSHVVDQGFLFEEYPADFCAAMRNSRLHILPDLNGNGANELLVISTRSFLLSLERGPAPLEQAQGGPDIIAKEISSVYHGN